MAPEQSRRTATLQKRRMSPARLLRWFQSGFVVLAEVCWRPCSRGDLSTVLLRAPFRHAVSYRRAFDRGRLAAVMAPFGVGDAQAVEAGVALGAVGGRVADPEADQDRIAMMGN